MKEIVITDREAGQRLDKLLGKYLKAAPKSFIYKMLRKKNITLNGKKAEGAEKLQCRDVIRLYFAEETLEKFTGAAQKTEGGGTGETCRMEELLRRYPARKLDIIYEDDNVILVNKPAGMLSQKAGAEDVSLVEYLIGYLLREGSLTADELERFHPSVCNRLDRNTSGLVAAGKTMAGLQGLSLLFHDRTMHKYYRCLVKGEIKESCYLEGYLKKNGSDNQVTVSEQPLPEASLIKTEYRPVMARHGLTLLEVTLITGRSHQIRAHLASIGHPIVGDAKYGDPSVNERFRREYGLKYQLLHSYRLQMPELTGALANLSGREFIAPLPEKFRMILGCELEWMC